jgi:creatinine amidohydrolase
MTSHDFISAACDHKAIAACRPTLAILPVGACEQHGPHLPIYTDTCIAQAIATQVTVGTDWFLLPTVPYGTSAEHWGFAGTISLRPETLRGLVEDVVQSCTKFGVRRVVVLSGHGGNWILRPAVRQLNVTHDDLTVGLVPETVMWAGTLTTDDLHAGYTETCLMLHLDPRNVSTPPEDFVPSLPREALDILPTIAISQSGVWGCPSGATAQKGAALLKQMVDNVKTYIQAAFIPLADRRESLHRVDGR